jgi:hypothetical protein
MGWKKVASPATRRPKRPTLFLPVIHLDAEKAEQKGM